VSRRWATTTQPTACCLAAVPGGADGPGGVLVGGEDWIEYLHESIASSSAAFTKIACAVPRRKLHPSDKGIIITKIAVHRQKKSKFFALAQSELGDVYKVILVADPADKCKVVGMKVALLDTLPTANALNISDLGMLFVAAEFGDHQLYQFLGIDLPDAPTTTSEETVAAFDKQTEIQASNAGAFLTTARASKLAPTFQPTLLKNLRKIYTMDNPSPTTGVLVGELAGNEVSPQIYTLTGRGPHSALRILRHGASVTELAISEDTAGSCPTQQYGFEI
jgi:splicing factor 3B subunit 3